MGVFNSKRKKIICLVSLLFVLAAGVFAVRVRKIFFPTLQEVYEINWGIDLPDEMELVNNFHTPSSFHGDGYRYTVFSLEKKSVPIGECYRGGMRKEFAERILEELEVPIEYWPDFKKEFVWKKMTKYSDTLFLLCDEAEGLLYLFEELI